MTKDGLGDKVSRVLHQAYDSVLDEPLPPRFCDLLQRLSENDHAPKRPS
jgi:hypothetical protein